MGVVAMAAKLGLSAVLDQTIEDVVVRLDAQCVPDAKVVVLVGSFNRWDSAVHHLVQDTAGWWTITLSLPPGEYPYLFLVDGVPWNDPQDDGRIPSEWGIFYSLRVVRPRAYARSGKG